MFELMLPALVASLVLVGLHAYLGIHIIARGVIFVDLALAQVAALGWAAAGLGLGQVVGGVLGLSDATAGYFVGLAATLIAAALFSASRMKHPYVPQEAIIGIVFVVATAGTILLAAQAPRGSEHVEQLLTGGLLWVTWPEIWKTAIAYAVIGIAHWFLRERFLTISLRPQDAAAHGWRVRWWDFVFYSLFGVMVTLSVRVPVHVAHEPAAGHRVGHRGGGDGRGIVHLVRHRHAHGSGSRVRLRRGPRPGVRPAAAAARPHAGGPRRRDLGAANVPSGRARWYVGQRGSAC
jgi:ABC-type Mn2+/Zn2+ transport system permease subunit